MSKPLFFGSRDRPLFGVYHSPTAGSPAERAVVLCHPLPQEYGSVHWVFRRLAALLAQRGAHVLRFDYHGTGDSGGEGGETTFESMVQDTRIAASELVDACGVRRVSIIGMRFGAAVAARVRDTAVRDVVLWEPVLRGRDHLEELRRVHRKREVNWLLPRARPARGEEDLLGYPRYDVTRRSIEGVDLATGPWTDARSFTVVVSSERPEHRALESALGAAGKKVRLVVAEDPAGDVASKAGAALVSTSVLAHVADAVVAPSSDIGGARP
ncbi:hypothetical protein BH09MYX1_BH09MYX1_54960 [soil metagenome]